MFRFFGLLGSTSLSPSDRVRRPVRRPTFRPGLESLEGRVVMNAAAAMAPPSLAPALAAPVVSGATQATSILPINVTNIVNNAGSLVANATMGATSFQIPLTLGVPSGQSAASSTQILNLHLGEIHLNVLGLKVDTSEICLNITAQTGPGNLLGNLLAGVAGALDNGTSLNDILGGLTGSLDQLTAGLTGLLNGAFGALTTPTNALPGASVTSSGSTSILHLSVGPLHLNLLGLDVTLDNCHNGPITVDISAQSGPGQLLGNLLGNVAHLLDSHAATGALTNALRRVANDITGILGAL